MMSRRALRIAPASLVLACGCTPQAPVPHHGPDVAIPAGDATCRAIGGASMLTITLMFGRTRPDGSTIAERDWDAFLRDVVTPRFPDGLSVIGAEGQWRDRSTGRQSREASRLVWIVTPDRPSLRQDLDAVRAAYRAMFAQQSVGIVAVAGCAAF